MKMIQKLANRPGFISVAQHARTAFILAILFVVTACADYEKNTRENFNKNFDAFQKLEQMQREDIKVLSSVRLIDEHPVEFAYNKGLLEKVAIKNFSNERWNEYRKLLKQAGVDYFSYVSDEPKKRMVRFGELEYVEHGYVYMEFPPIKFFNSYKECKPILPSNSCYIYLRKNWYMYSERYRLKQE